jgi:hypothetical protein
MQAAGKYLDALSLNVYNYWAPPADLMTMWSGQSGKPFLVTEWYTKGEDSGYPNTSGAGWNCPTQRDRGWFYQNFTLAAGVEELRRLALVQRPGQFSDRSFQPRFQQGYREPLPTERVSI